MKQPTESKIVLTEDAGRKQRITADLNTACELINGAIAKLEGEYLLPLKVTEKVVRDICLHDASCIVNAIKDAFSKDSQLFKMPYARKMYADNAEAAVARVYEIFAELEAGEREHKFDLRLSDYDRANFLHVADGKAAYDLEEIAEHCTTYAVGEKAAAYIQRAQELHKAMADFDREAQLLSRGAIRGVSDSDTDKPCIVTVIDGVLWLDLAGVESLDFDNAETLLSSGSGKAIENAKIAKVER